MDSTVVYLTEHLTQGLHALAENLQVPAEQVFGVLVRQAYLEGVLFLVIGVVFLLLASLFIWLSFGKKCCDPDEVTIFLSLLFIGLVLMMAWRGVPRLCNPEYYAVREILGIFG